MNASSHIRKFQIVAVALSIGVAYLDLWSPEQVVVQDTGKVTDLTNQVRATLQGKGFWKTQLLAIKKELTQLLGEPKRNAEIKRELGMMGREFEKDQRLLYRDYPDMRPSAAERHAETLRERADAIEQAELERELERFRRQRLAELRPIKQLIEVRAT